MNLTVLSYNIHKGYTPNNRRYVLDEIREGIRKADADLVLLQEVVGENESIPGSQFEHLADTVWSHHTYGKNAVYDTGHHGNAILSKFPIVEAKNINISTNSFEQRGLLHSKIYIPERKLHLDALCAHLNLFENGRRKQALAIAEYVRSQTTITEPLLLGGDFNDWTGNVSQVLHDKVELPEVFRELKGSFARTFPSFLPLLRLDRLHFRHLEPRSCEVLHGAPWNQLSDHAPLLARFTL